MRKIAQGTGFLGLALALSLPLFGQITTGTISGTIKDASGAVMPGASVTIQNQDTGAQRTVTSDARGYYTAPNLSLGKYEVTASLSGFQTAARGGITLSVGQNAVIDFTLNVGAVTERVEVTAEAPLIETTTASVAGLVNERQVQDLPLNARNLIELAPLYAGVAFADTGERSASKGMGTKLTISGTRYNASLFQLDGLSINDSTGTAGSASGILMGAETIREFNVITNGYSAEYGKHSGGVFNAVTKSGTNSLHGSAFEFLRNDKLDARNFFDRDPKHPTVRSDTPPYKRNQFGGSLGGPIIPDRSFFFGSYEGLRERLGKTYYFKVPDLATRATTTVNAEIKPYLLSYPEPNGTDFAGASAEYITSRSLPTSEDFLTGRVDHTISDKDTLFGRYTFDDGENMPTTSLNVTDNNVSRSHYVAIGETRVFSSTVINQFLAGFSRSNIGQFNTAIPGMVFPRTKFTSFTGGGIAEDIYGTIGTSGTADFDTWGGGSTRPRAYLDNMYQFKDDVYYTKGSHSLKFGFNAERIQFNHKEYFNSAGVWSFTSLSTFLAGTVNNFQALTPTSDPADYVRQSFYGMYAQDDYHLSDRLTVNLGLRYEFITVPVQKYGRLANMHDLFTPGQTTANFTLGNPFFENPSLKNFAPRVGIAWDPTGSGKTSIRAGAGIFHEQINAGTFLFGMASSPPYYVVGNIRGSGVAKFPNAFFTQQSLLADAGNIEGFQFKASQPAVYKYSFDIQHEVIPNTSVTLGYSGTRGVHLMRVLNMNARVAALKDGRLFVTGTAPFIHEKIGRIRPRFTDVSSDYNALRLSVTRRYSSGLQAQGSYTWSKTLDDASNWTGSSDWGNSPGQGRYLAIKDRGLAPFDLRHSFVGNFTYDLPGGRLAGVTGKLLGGWQVSGIVSLQTGNPFNVSTGVAPSYFSSAFVSDYPDVVAGKEVKYDTRNPEHYFDPAGAFSLPFGYANPSGGANIGNAGRSILTAPGQAKFDMVLAKSTQLTERLELQFRSEFFNLFNRANFGFPESRLYQTTAGAPYDSLGRITSTRGTSRQIQFGLRLAF